MRYVFVLLLMVIAAACGGSKETAEGDEWKEMEEFHIVMADYYHPIKDEGNVAPIKGGADKLAAAAEKWAQAPLPAKVDNEDVKTYLGRLQDRSKTLAANIGTMSDDAIKEEMTSLHDIFHQAMDAWYHAPEGAAGEHKDH
ncbi:MAG TPA: hypothetical protein VFE50_10750 [Cyclobacteriaceae bacterium]|nr:hypothetical protein [Cyclobacteriaceae bacterium]